MKEYVEVEIIDENGDSITNKPVSAIEMKTNITGYKDFISRVSRIDADLDELGFGDAKMYSFDLGKSVWKGVLMAATPLSPRDDKEKELINSIYKLLFAMAEYGEYPLKEKLCVYLGVDLDEFYDIIRTPTHPNSNAYAWANRVFDTAASDNALKSNGNNQARQWIDRSVEGKMAADDRLELRIKASAIDKARIDGESIYKELMNMEDDSDE